MTFEEVLPKAREGWAISNPNWNGDVVALFIPQSFSLIQMTFLYIEREGKMLAVYNPTQQDLFSNKFELVEFRTKA